ncbi:hypothetical protein CWS35_16180 [Bradyrhizobium sp. SK17]|nr:DUF1194 domain-containing protein [Bradyrhizobium sp. SK17]AUC95600.1 hypothetical protein CWS35_16180 [Bradyrhizobium sp. SK17]
MRHTSVGTALVATILMSGTVAGDAAPRARFASEKNAPTVDVELILAVDVSHSMTVEELAIQREGYAHAIRSDEFIRALQSGPNGRISIAYFEWSGPKDQRIIVPWSLVDGPEAAGVVASQILSIPVERGTQTSISGAIRFAMPLFDRDPYTGTRRVIDISGDGANNSGPPVLQIRHEALAKGLIINGLPMMMNEFTMTMDVEHLDWYYEDCIIGGSGSFMVPINSRDKLKESILIKLVREISDRTADRPVNAVSNQAPRVNCAINEKIFDDR